MYLKYNMVLIYTLTILNKKYFNFFSEFNYFGFTTK